jgi:hypothetical protein
MRIEVGHRYRHKITCRVFEVIEITVASDPIEGGLGVGIVVDTCDDDCFRLTVGMAPLERWWPHLEEVDRGPEVVADAKASGFSPIPFPWCSLCGQRHHRDDPHVVAK